MPRRNRNAREVYRPADTLKKMRDGGRPPPRICYDCAMGYSCDEHDGDIHREEAI